jgi:hypothetical protein
MTTVMRPSPAPANAKESLPAPEGWSELRRDDAIQFDQITIPEPKPREPGWFEELLKSIGEWFADLFAPVGNALGSWWPLVKWGLIGLLALFVIYLIYRLVMPLGLRPRSAREIVETPEWAPNRAESMALLEDADRLAAEGKFDEATHLLLQRSVGQIAQARPDWVEPSSTARELAALPALSEAARGAFAVISERVERSLFALRSLERTDWEAARAAYADFALAKIDAEARP